MKKKCDKCDREITLNNYDKHNKVCKGKKILIEQFKTEEGYKCPECGEVYKKLGIKSHIWSKHGPGLQEGKRKFKVGRYSWNKGLTKETDERVKENGKVYLENVKNKKTIPKHRGKKLSKERKNKMSITIKEKVKNGTWHYSFSKVRTHEYRGIKLHGKWELQYAKWLDENNIKWRRPKEKFAYEFEDRERFYTPDFYLIDTSEYIEIKGYETDKDRAKWSCFPLKLRIIKGKELFDLKIINEKQFKGIE